MRHSGASVTAIHPTEPRGGVPGGAPCAGVSSPLVRSPLPRPGSLTSPSRGRVVLLAAGLALAAALGGCASDGRYLRPPRADQNGSVSTIAATTAPSNPIIDNGADGLVPASVSTLPGEPLGSSDVGAVGELGFAVLSGPVGEGASLPATYTCDGADLSPALSWTPAPDGTAEIAVTLTDVDAPGYVHWAMAGLSPTATALGEGQVPVDAIVGLSSAGTVGYTGPCPPQGDRPHHYVFTVHFLMRATELATGASGDDLLAAIEDATFDSASYTVQYGRA